MYPLPRLIQTILTSPRKGLLSNYQVFCRKCSVNKAQENQSESSSADGFKTVYKFPMIRFFSAFHRLKIYHVYATLIGVPMSFILASQGLVDPECPIATACSCFSLGAFLFGTSVTTNRYIGFIYLNEKKEFVKVAYIDYWGKRRDMEIPLNDIMPFSETPMNFIGHYLYKPIHLYSGGKCFKLSSNQGTIVDKEKFNKIFLDEIK